MRAELPQLVLDVAGGLADRRRDLEHRLHQLRADPLVELAVHRRRQHRVHVLDEVERLRVEEHVLLLDTERERVDSPKLWSSTLPPSAKPLPVIEAG